MSKPQNEQEWREKCLELARLGVGPVARRLGNAMTPKPESETDPWGLFEEDVQRYSTPSSYVQIMSSYAVARAAEAAQRQQEIAEKDAHLGRMLSNRYDADVVELRAELAAKDETIRQQAKQMATLEAERDRLKAALEGIAALDLDCECGHRGRCLTCAIRRKLRDAALTPHGQSTDGEPR